MKLSAVAIAASTLLLAHPASAHAHLEKATPGDGSTLSASPAALEMAFSEAARLTALWIQKGDEPRQALKDLPTSASRTVRVALPPLAPGSYTITWRVLAADGHVTSGALHLTISAGPH